MVALCQGYHWYLDGGIRLRNLPNPSITYPIEYRFDCPLVFAVNRMHEQANKVQLLPGDWLWAGDFLGIDYDNCFDMMLHIDWDGHTKHPKGEQRHFDMWTLRFHSEVRKILLTLLD